MKNNEISFDSAIKNIDNGEFEKAKLTLEKLIKNSPDDYNLIETWALLMTMMDNIEEAIKSYKKAIKLNPKNTKNYYFLGKLYSNSGRKVESMAILSSGIHKCIQRLKRFPADLETIKDLIRINSYRNEHEKALLTIFTGLNIDNKDIELLRFLLQEYYHLNHFPQVLKEGKEILAIYENESTILLYMGLAYYKLNLNKLAVEFLEKSLKYNPDRHEVKELKEKLKLSIKKNGLTIEELIYYSPDISDHTGVVKWFKDESGIGYINSDDRKEDIFVHYLAIDKEGYQSLQEGQKVKFGLISSPRGEVATHVKEIDSSNIYYGKVIEFNDKNGTGKILYNEDKKISFHFTSIIGTGIRLIPPGIEVRFEIFETESGLNSFNIKPIDKNIRSKFSRNSKVSGKILWYDKDKGTGIIANENMKAIFHDDDIESGIPVEGKIVKFIPVILDSLEKENIKKAKDIEIEK